MAKYLEVVIHKTICIEVDDNSSSVREALDVYALPILEELVDTIDLAFKRGSDVESARFTTCHSFLGLIYCK